MGKDQPDWAAAQRAVPNNANIPALLKLLARSATAAHVTMQSITLSGSSSSSSAPAPTPTTTTAVNGALGLVSVPVSLTFSGGYQALNRLVNRLGALVTISRRQLRASGPLVGISAVTVTPSATGSGSALSFALTATIYQRSAGTTEATG